MTEDERRRADEEHMWAVAGTLVAMAARAVLTGNPDAELRFCRAAEALVAGLPTGDVDVERRGVDL